jgi:phosphate transport system protein
MDLGMSTVNETLIEMGDIAERTLQIALDSYFKNDGSRKKVVELSEELRGLADEISDIAVELVARYQPVAKDLRLIRVSMEMAYIFWRLSRYSYDIIDTIEILNPVLDGDCDKTPVTETS